MTEVTMTRNDTRRLHRLAARLEEELSDLALAGIGDGPRAEAVREELETVQAKIREAKTARQEAESAQWEAEAKRKREQAAREAEDREKVDRARAFLVGALSGVPVEREALVAKAAAAGIGSGHLLAACRDLGVRELAEYGRGGRVWSNSRRGWALPSNVPVAGWAAMGAPSI